MLDCREISRRFHQSFVSSKTREIFETTSFDRHYSFDQSEESISLSIEMLDWEDMLKDSKWSDIMISWDDKMNWWNNKSKTFSFEKEFFWSDDLIIWFNQLTFILLHHHSIFHAWTIRSRIAFIYLKRFESSILHQFVDFASSRFTIIQSRWFFSYLLIFEIVEKSMNSKMNM